MSAQARCHCQSCTIRGLTGPAIVIAVGVLFLLHQVHGGHFDLRNTWPVLLLVIGLLQLASALASHQGHIERVVVPPFEPPPVAPPANPQQRPYGTQGH
jgi:hypothetical protein